MSERVAILGVGGVGGLLAALLHRQGHEVICIGSAEKVAAIERDGISVDSAYFGQFVARPLAAVQLSDSVRLLFVAAKAPWMASRVRAIAPSAVENGVVVPLLNGIGHSEVLRARFGPRVATGIIGSVEVILRSDGVVQQPSYQRPHIELASDGDIPRASLEHVADTIRPTGIQVSILDTEAEVVWRKLARLDAIASVTAAFQVPLGVVRSEPRTQSLLAGAVVEAVSIARREGVVLSASTILAQIEALPAALTTSLQRDLEAGELSELEWITGAVLRRARQYGIAAPAHETLYGLLRDRIPAGVNGHE